MDIDDRGCFLCNINANFMTMKCMLGTTELRQLIEKNYGLHSNNEIAQALCECSGMPLQSIDVTLDHLEGTH